MIASLLFLRLQLHFCHFDSYVPTDLSYSILCNYTTVSFTALELFNKISRGTILTTLHERGEPRMKTEKTASQTFRYEVGKPLPGYTPPPENGGQIGITDVGKLCLLIQHDKPNKAEWAALEKGFSSYSYYVSKGYPTMAVWSLKFPEPVGYVEAFTHTGIFPDDSVERYLAMELNELYVLILDGTIIRDMAIYELNSKAVKLFKDTIRRYQMKESIDVFSMEIANANICRMSPEQVFRSGHVFLTQ